MDIKVGDYVTLRSWEEVKDGDTLNISERTWIRLQMEPRKVVSIDDDPTCTPRFAYFIADESDEDGWYVLESAIESVRRDFK